MVFVFGYQPSFRGIVKVAKAWAFSGQFVPPTTYIAALLSQRGQSHPRTVPACKACPLARLVQPCDEWDCCQAIHNNNDNCPPWPKINKIKFE